ncbi:MAG: phosphotransferase [Lachnospiraceae bacterium]|nr:phosphotransferase [Lachnospiraceae bacterium]
MTDREDTQAMRNDGPVIDCAGLQMIGRGVTAVTYRLDDTKVLKAYKKGITKEQIAAERAISEKMCRYGVKTPVCYDTVRTPEGFGNVYQYLHGNILTAPLLKADDVSLPMWMAKYATLAKSVNGVCAGDDMPAILDQYEEHLKLTEELLTPEVVRFIRETFAAVPAAENLLHGDLSTGNIMIDGDELYLIDLATMAKGHPVFELTVPYMVTLMWSRFARIAAEMTQEERAENPDWFAYVDRYTAKALPGEMGLPAWRQFVKAYFGLATAEDPFITQVTEMVHVIAMCKYCLCGSFKAIYAEALVKKMAAFYSEELMKCPSPRMEVLKDDRWNIQENK